MPFDLAGRLQERDSFHKTLCAFRRSRPVGQSCDADRRPVRQQRDRITLSTASPPPAQTIRSITAGVGQSERTRTKQFGSCYERDRPFQVSDDARSKRSPTPFDFVGDSFLSTPSAPPPPEKIAGRGEKKQSPDASHRERRRNSARREPADTTDEAAPPPAPQ